MSFLGLIYDIAYKLGASEERIQKWDEWVYGQYYKNCSNPIRWRFWFEVTGQGHGARRYMRMQFDQKWYETRKSARTRMWREMVIRKGRL